MAIKLTKTAIEALEPRQAQYTVYDTALQGFGVRVGATSKAFVVVRRIPGSHAPKRVTIGKVGQLTVEQARSQASHVIAQLVAGKDINAERRAQRDAQAQELAITQARQVQDGETLEWLIDFYRDEKLMKKKIIKERTIKDLEGAKKFFGARQCHLLTRTTKGWTDDGKTIILENWLARPFRSIEMKEVMERFDALSVTKPHRVTKPLKPIQRSHQLAFKMVQSAYILINKRKMLDGETIKNPFTVLTALDKWGDVGVRTRHLPFRDPESFSAWWDALQELQYTAPRDYILCTLLQAGRSVEMCNLTWECVDLKLKEIRYKETKNLLTYIFPMSDMVYDILKRRYADKPKSNNFVFYQTSHKSGHVTQDCKSHFESLAKKSGTYVSMHDLKRTWASTAEHLKQHDAHIKYILKHKKQGVDQNYFMQHVDDFKALMQTVEDYYVSQAAKGRALVQSRVQSDSTAID